MEQALFRLGVLRVFDFLRTNAGGDPQSSKVFFVFLKINLFIFGCIGFLLLLAGFL